MDKVFVNEAFSKAISDYQSSVDNPQGIKYNSFLVVVIRLLISIYSELDIINPYMMEDEELLKLNLAKFNYDKVNIELFLSNLELFYDYEIVNEEKKIKSRNPYFIEIQKSLVDMFICKKLNFYITEEETNIFYDLLYTPYSKNPLRVSFNFLQTKNPLEIDNYFRKEMRDKIKIILPKEKNYLNIKAYELLNMSFDTIKNLSENELNKVNSEVYDYFKIRENAINKEYLLEKAIEAKLRENNKITSGNGYVDILLVMSVVCTALMILGIVVFILI